MVSAKPGVSRMKKNDFENDLEGKNGRVLPKVSWIIPPYHYSEHPAYSPLKGAYWLAEKVNALLRSKYWVNTALIITCDENGGLFDHVVPPIPNKGEPGEWITKHDSKYVGQSAGPGFRVPCIIVSPWTVGGRVASATYDHTSILRFLGTFTNVAPANVSAFRKKTFGNLETAFDFSHWVAAENVPAPPHAPEPPDFDEALTLTFPEGFPAP